MSRDGVPTAAVRIKGPKGTVCKTAVGDGPIDAVYQAISKATGVTPKLDDYRLQSVTAGTDAMARVTVKVSDARTQANGHGSHTDIFVASAKAYLDAINKLVYITERGERRTAEEPNVV